MSIRNEERIGNSRHRWLFLPVETKVRELDAKLLLALAAAEAGWKVLLGSQREIRRKLHKYPPGVYLDKSVTISKREWFKECKRMRHRIVVLDEEGLVYFDDEVFQYLRLDDEAVSLVDMMLLWGQRQHRSIVNTIGYPDCSLAVTGNPRIDVLREELRDIYAMSTRRIRSRFGRIILVNASFPLANHYLGSEAMHAMYAKYPINRKRPNFYTDWAKVHTAALDNFRRMIPILPAEFPDHSIILRPHPSENHNNWVEWTKTIPRTTMIAEGSVVEWMAAADVTIQFDCTSGIEAFAMGKSSIAFDDQIVKGYRQPLPNALSLESSTVSELLQCINNVVDGTAHAMLHNEASYAIATDHIENLAGPLAIDRIVVALEEVSQDASYSIADRVMRARRTLGQWRERVRMRRAPKDDVYHHHKFAETTVDQITERACEMSGALQRFDGVTIEPAGRNCFILRT